MYYVETEKVEAAAIMSSASDDTVSDEDVQKGKPPKSRICGRFLGWGSGE